MKTKNENEKKKIYHFDPSYILQGLEYKLKRVSHPITLSTMWLSHGQQFAIIFHLRFGP